MPVCSAAGLADMLCIFYSITDDVVCMVNDEGSLMIAVRTSLLATFQLFFTCTFYQLSVKSCNFTKESALYIS